MHHVLLYEVARDFAARRLQWRAQHLAAAWRAAERGELLLGGAFDDPLHGAMLVFYGDAGVAERFAQQDPYVVHGLVSRWHVRRWNTVVGEGAAEPLRPAAP